MQGRLGPPSVRLLDTGATYSAFSVAPPGIAPGGLRVNSADLPNMIAGAIGPDWHLVSLPVLPMDFPGLLSAATPPPQTAGSEPLPASSTANGPAAPRQVSLPLQVRLCRFK